MLSYKTASIFGRHKETVGIQIGGGILRIAHARQRGSHKEVMNVYSSDISSLREDDIAGKINDFFKKEGIKNPEAVLAIPSYLTITKNIEVPSHDAGEIADIMNLQAARHTPYTREEIIVDYKTIGACKDNYTRILLTIVTREVVRKQLSIVNKAGIKVQRICFSSETAGKFLSDILNLGNDNFPSGLLYIDNSFSYFNIVFNKESIFSRSIPIGNQHLEDDYTRYAGQFVEEIKKSMEVYRSEGIENTPQRILLLMVPDGYKGLTSFLSSTVGIPFEDVSSLDHLVIKDKVKNVFSTVRLPSFIDVIAASLESDKAEINLIPEEIKLRKAFEEKSRQIIWMGFFIFSIIVVIFILTASRIAFKSLYLEDLRNQSKTIHKKARDLEDKFRRVQLVKRYLAQRGMFLEVLDKVYKDIPPTVKISELRFDKESKFVSIKGTAGSVTTIYSFVDDLSNEALFKDVKIKYTTKRKESNKEVADFELGITLNNHLKKE